MVKMWCALYGPTEPYSNLKLGLGIQPTGRAYSIQKIEIIAIRMGPISKAWVDNTNSGQASGPVA